MSTVETLQFHEEISKMAWKSILEDIELFNISTEIENFLLDMFSNDISDIRFQHLLVFISAFQRNFLLAWFLFQAR